MDRLEQFDRLQDTYAYEERIMLWRAESFDEAITLAEAEGRKYCEVLAPAEYRWLRHTSWQIHLGVLI